MLFKTVDEIKGFLPVTASFDFPDIEPFINSTEEDDIIPFLSQEQYNLLDDHYNADPQTLTADEIILLKKVRRPLANMAYLKYIPFGNVMIGKGHISVSKNDGEEIASQWRIDDLRNACDDDYYKGIEQMLLYLEKNKATFTEWAASDAFTQFNECFITTAVDFNKSGFDIGNSRRMFLLMKGLMVQAEKDYIKSVTGAALFAEIKTQIAADTVTDANEDLLDFIKPAVANFTGAAATLRLQAKFTKQGIQIFNTKAQRDQSLETEAADQGQLKSLRDAAIAEGLKQQKLLYSFLYKNHATYPLYEADTTVYTAVATDDLNNGTRGTMWF